MERPNFSITQTDPNVTRMIEFALRVCTSWLNELEAHPRRIDPSTASTSLLSDVQWNELLEFSYLATDNHARPDKTKTNVHTALPVPRSRANRPMSARPSSARCALHSVMVNRDDSALAAGVRSLQELGRRNEISDYESGDVCSVGLRVPYNTVHRADASLTSTLSLLCEASVGVVRRLRNLWPQWDIDGSRNIWVIKAPEACRGHGIVLHRRLDRILSLADRMSGRVVQKYVENPLTWRNATNSDADGELQPARPGSTLEPCHGPKFDLRLWCLFVGSKEHVYTYLYEPCYARLCSQPFTLDESSLNNPCIHLSNLAVQRRERENMGRKVPNDESLMRTQVDLETQLAREHTSRSRPLWSTSVRPGIARIISGLSAAVMAHASPRPRSFELVGVDVLLDESLKPWLLEVNLSPALARRSDSHSHTIASMLGGILHLTVDRWFSRGVPGHFDGQVSGWTLACKLNTPPPLPQASSRSYELRVTCKGVGIHNIRVLDDNLSRVQAWHTLRKWWRKACPARAARRLLQRHSQCIIAHLSRQWLVRRSLAAQRLQRSWRAFALKQRAQTFSRRRLAASTLLQARFRQWLAFARVRVIEQVRHCAARCIASSVVKWYESRNLVKRIDAIKRAVQVAYSSLDYGFAVVAFASAASDWINRQAKRYVAERINGAVRLQSRARRCAAIGLVAEQRQLRRRVHAATQIQSKMRQHLNRRAQFATRLQQKLQLTHADRQRRLRRGRSIVAIILQRTVRQKLQLARMSAVKKLLATGVTARLCCLVTRNRSTAATASYVVCQARYTTEPPDTCNHHASIPNSNDDESNKSAELATAHDSWLCERLIEQESRDNIVEPTSDVEPAVQGNDEWYQKEGDPFLLEVSRFHNRMIASPYDSKLRWKTMRAGTKITKRDSMPFCSLSQSLLCKTGSVSRKKSATRTKGSIFPGDASCHPKSRKVRTDTKESKEAMSFLWAGSPRALTHT